MASHLPWTRPQGKKYVIVIYKMLLCIKAAAMDVDSVQYTGIGKLFYKEVLYLYTLQSRVFT